MANRFLCILAAIAALSSTCAAAVTVTGDSAGNLYVSDGPMRFSIAGASGGSVSYSLIDYFGRNAASGSVPVLNGSATINLAGFRPGWYQLNCTDAAGTVSAAVGVVINRGGAALPAEGRIGVDAATAGLVFNESYRQPLARMVRLAGIPWVRERMVWGAVEPGKDYYNWGIYQTVADDFAAEGVRISQVWLYSPTWSHPANPTTYYPDDLRYAYSFAKTAAQHFSTQIQAWELWNEPELTFWPDLPDKFVGLCKAAYLGFKTGNPTSTIAQGGWCLGASSFIQEYYESDMGPYYDVFNWHMYNTPANFPQTLATYRGVTDDYGLQDRPSWMTECGIFLSGTDGPDHRLLSPANQRVQCRFVPKSVVMGLVAGNDRHFFFVLPDYLENGTQFGLLYPDLTPYPSFVALSAAANILGLSNYIGQYPAGSISAYAFSTPQGNVVAAWADQAGQLSVPTEKANVRVADIFGNESTVAASGGYARVSVGPDAVYLIDVGESIKAWLTGTPVPRGVMPNNNPARVVLSGHTSLPMDKTNNAYTVGSGQQFAYDVEVYNFSETSSASGTVTVSVPANWRVVQPTRSVSLAPMDRKVITFEITADTRGQGILRLTAQGQFSGQSVGRSISYILIDPSAAVTGLQSVYWGGTSWQRYLLSPYMYSSLTFDMTLAKMIYGARIGGGIDRFYDIGQGWVMDHPNTTTSYSAITSDHQTGNSIFAARSGGLDWIHWTGVWTTELLNSQTYSTLVTDASSAKTVYGARAGGLDRVSFGTSWQTQTLNSNSYLALASDRSSGNMIYGARAGGGLDRIYLNGGSWVTEPISANSYTALAADAVSTKTIYGSRAAGLDCISWNGSAWVVEPVSSVVYAALTTDAASPKMIYGARAEGGLDRIRWNGTAWVTENLNSNCYVTLTRDWGLANTVYGSAVTAPVSILDGKGKPDGAQSYVKGIVTAVFGDCFYIESTDRCGGIRVDIPNSGLTIGRTVQVAGSIESDPATGERYIGGGVTVCL